MEIDFPKRISLKSAAEYEVIQALRNVDENTENFSKGWIKTKHGSFYFNRDSGSGEKHAHDLVDKINAITPTGIIEQPDQQDLVCILPVADPHFGNTATDTGKILFEGVQKLKKKIDMYRPKQIVFANCGDWLHTEGSFGTTHNGTEQEMGKPWHDAFLEAFQFAVDTLTLFSKEYLVHYLGVPGNHDKDTNVLLSHSLQQKFSNHEQITFDVSPSPRKYVAFGNSICGFTHGDHPKKSSDYLRIMKSEATEHCMYAKHFTMFEGHVHNRKSKSSAGIYEDGSSGVVIIDSKQKVPLTNNVRVEVLDCVGTRGLGGWEIAKGYTETNYAVSSFIIDPIGGSSIRIIQNV